MKYHLELREIKNAYGKYYEQLHAIKIEAIRKHGSILENTVSTKAQQAVMWHNRKQNWSLPQNSEFQEWQRGQKLLRFTVTSFHPTGIYANDVTVEGLGAWGFTVALELSAPNCLKPLKRGRVGNCLSNHGPTISSIIIHNGASTQTLKDPESYRVGECIDRPWGSALQFCRYINSTLRTVQELIYGALHLVIPLHLYSQLNQQVNAFLVLCESL